MADNIKLSAIEQADLELKLLEIEERKANIESKRIQDELNRIQLSEAKQKLETVQNNKARGKADAAVAMKDYNLQKQRCNHYQGGKGAEGIAAGRGDKKRNPCVGGQLLPDGTWVFHCVRCHKEWRTGDKDFAIGAQLFEASEQIPMLCPQRVQSVPTLN